MSCILVRHLLQCILHDCDAALVASLRLLAGRRSAPIGSAVASRPVLVVLLLQVAFARWLSNCGGIIHSITVSSLLAAVILFVGVLIVCLLFAGRISHFFLQTR
jgi:hypothetical protein